MKTKTRTTAKAKAQKKALGLVSNLAKEVNKHCKVVSKIVKYRPPPKQIARMPFDLSDGDDVYPTLVILSQLRIAIGDHIYRIRAERCSRLERNLAAKRRWNLKRKAQ